jgi:hypothetical protein
MASNFAKVGDLAFKNTEKINCELLAFTYGALVMRLIRESESVEEVNKQLEAMGANIGRRLIEDLLAKTRLMCTSIRELAEIIGVVAFKMYLGVSADIRMVSDEDKEFFLILPETGLTDYVEIPDSFRTLRYLNIFCGVIKGGLEMLGYETLVTLDRDQLLGDETTEIKVKIVKKTEALSDEPGP